MNLMFLYFNLLYVLYIKRRRIWKSQLFKCCTYKAMGGRLVFLKFLNKLYVKIIADYLLKTGINCR